MDFDLSDDQQAKDNRDLAAMGFLTLGRRFLGIQADIIDDRIDTLSRTTLGLTVGCARCHDHKFDPIPTADYYSLYGVFANSTERYVRLGPEPDMRPDPVFVGDLFQIGEDLGPGRVAARPALPGGERERVEVRGNVAGRARVGVGPPDAADAVGALEDGEVADAGLEQLDAHADAAEPRPHDPN